MQRTEEDFGWKKLVQSFWFLLGSAKWKWLLLTLVIFAIQFYVVVPALIVGKIVDLFTVYKSGNSIQLFYVYTMTLGISFIIVSFVRLSLKRMAGDVMSNVVYEAKVKGFEKLLDFSLAWHLKENAGAKAQRVNNGIEALKVLYRRFSSEIMRSLASIIGVMSVFLFIQPKYILFFLVYIFGFWVIVLSFNRRIQRENDMFFASVEKAGGSYVEGLSNILTIKTLGVGTNFKNHIATKEKSIRDHEFVLRLIKNNMWKCYQAFNGLCYGAFLFFIVQDVIAGSVTAGALVIFFGYMQKIVENSNDMIEVYEVVLDAKSAIGRMMSIFSAKTVTHSGDRFFPEDWQDIVIDKLHFSYEKGKKDQETLADISLTIPQCSKVGLVGKTGSGKSTFAKILAGLYSINSGSYRIGDVSFYDLTHEDQTQKITLVLQETEIFNLTLRENITLLREIDDITVARALSIAQLEEVVVQLPNGLDTLVGEKGYHLSGGERQRVGIARAICKNSPIIIFDEATSSLDNRTEFLIQEALETQLKERTIISIAHRVSTLEKSDMIYVFENGRIVEKGKFDLLMTDTNSRFFALNKRKQNDVR